MGWRALSTACLLQYTHASQGEKGTPLLGSGHLKEATPTQEVERGTCGGLELRTDSYFYQKRLKQTFNSGA